MEYKYNLVIADIETNAIENFTTLDCPIKFHCISILDVKTLEMHEFNTLKDNIEDGIKMLEQSKYVCGHNFIGFDGPCIEKVYGLKLNKIVDTMLMSKLFCRDITITDRRRENFPTALVGKHSLKAWGWRLGNFKGNHGEKEDAWEYCTPEMQQYCSQDVKVTYDLYKHLIQYSVSSKSLELEHDFARLIRVQELNGFPFDVEKAEELAKELSVILMISLFEKKLTGFYHNTSIVINEKGKIISKYRKMHIPDDPGYYEKFYFSPGDLGFKSTKTIYGKIGSLICWDQWFPEAARLTALKGAEILFYPTAIGWHPKEKKKFGKAQLNAWITMQRSHAVANGVYVAAINRIGFEKIKNRKIQFWGNSIIIDPYGNVLRQSHFNREETIICDIDFKKIEDARQHWPFLRDRRIDYYKGLLKNPEDE